MFVASGIHMNTRTIGFTTQCCIVTKWWRLITLPGRGVNVVADLCILGESLIKKKSHNTPVLLLTSPSAQGTQSKQQIGSPFLLAIREPGGQLSLHTDRKLCEERFRHSERHWLQLIFTSMSALLCNNSLYGLFKIQMKRVKYVKHI